MTETKLPEQITTTPEATPAVTPSTPTPPMPPMPPMPAPVATPVAAPAPDEKSSKHDEPEEVTEIKSPSVAVPPATDITTSKPSVTIEVAKAPQAAPFAELNINQVLENILIPLVVELGRVSLTISGIGELKDGSIIELSRTPSDAVDLVVAGKSIGKGELVDIEGDLGVRIISLVK